MTLFFFSLDSTVSYCFLWLSCPRYAENLICALCRRFFYISFKPIKVHHQVKTLLWTLSSDEPAKQSSGVFTYANTVQRQKFHFVKNWNLIYEAPCRSLLLEDGSGLMTNILPADISEILLQTLRYSSYNKDA